jgi:hypothetical protein
MRPRRAGYVRHRLLVVLTSGTVQIEYSVSPEPAWIHLVIGPASDCLPVMEPDRTWQGALRSGARRIAANQATARYSPANSIPPADHFGGMQLDDRPGRLAGRAGRIGQSLRRAADQHASRPPRRQHVIDHQSDVRVRCAL